MPPAAKASTESERGELRRQQVLDAAAECFRREGFHGSSISRISRAAGMSPGHIYHYFANKEAIVEAIAEREQHDVAGLVRRMDQDPHGGDLVARLTRHIAETVERNSDPAHIGLMLELAAEGARNPTVAGILRRTDQAIGAEFAALVERAGAPPGMTNEQVMKRLKMIATLIHGLAVRAVVGQDDDKEDTKALLTHLVRSLMETR